MKWEKGNLLPVILSAVAVLLAAVALLVAVAGPGRLHGRGISAYDLASADHAVKSLIEIEASGDLRAMLDLQAEHWQDHGEEMVSTFKVDRTVEHRGMIAVLYSFKEGGIDRYRVMWMEKHSDGTYRETHVSTLDWDTGPGDEPKIAKLIEDWEAKK